MAVFTCYIVHNNWPRGACNYAYSPLRRAATLAVVVPLGTLAAMRPNQMCEYHLCAQCQSCTRAYFGVFVDFRLVLDVLCSVCKSSERARARERVDEHQKERYRSLFNDCNRHIRIAMIYYIPKGVDGFIIVVRGGANCSNHDSFRIATQRVLQQMKKKNKHPNNSKCYCDAQIETDIRGITVHVLFNAKPEASA